MLKVDSSDFVPLKNVIQALSWKEKKYLDIKNAFIYKLSSIPTKASADYLKQVYYAAGDTVDMQYTALEALLQQKNLYAYQVFRDIMMDEPPVLQTTYNAPMAPPPVNTGYSEDFYDEDRNSNNGSFLDELKDSLALTKAIFRDLLPLINVNDYEQPMMNLLETMVDSNMISAKEYELYFPKFLIEAKQEMKKQIITEKNRSIEKAQADPDEKRNSYYEKQDRDYGNRKLSAYATLLMPFWDANASVPVFFRQMLRSNDRRLKYNTAILLLRNKRAVPDTLVTYYALQDDYRYELYADLKDMKQPSLFPKNHNHHVALAKSKLVGLNSYESPDTIAYLDRLPVQYKNRKGFVYFFKYRQKKDDNAWKLATVGLVPADAAVFEFENAGVKTEYEYNFTEMTSTKLDEEEPLKGQLQKLLKRKLYSKRKSGERFYDEENRYSQFASVFNFRD